MGRRSRIAVGLTATVLVGGVVLLTRCGVLAGNMPLFLVGGAPQLEDVELPPGFTIAIFAEVEGARQMTAGPNGIVFVGSRDAGKVYAVREGGEVTVIASGLTSPNGVAFRDGDLYVAEISRVIRFDDIADKLEAPPAPVVVNDTFPAETHHGWKFIAFGPDDMLYVPVGAPCDVCDPEDERFSTIMRMQPDGSGLEIFAHGIRNTVGFDWQPESGVLWFTDNGRDWMGDERPADELNRAPGPSMHFGFPYCHGRSLPDPDHQRLSCSETVAPALELGPHVAALGMRFYSGSRFPQPWREGVFIAEHGSWNRSTPIGYRVTYVPISGVTAGEPRIFAHGWLDGDFAWGRPVDVLVRADGSLLVSDDKAGLIYRIDYTGS